MFLVDLGGRVHPPSDFGGVLYIPYDVRGTWKWLLDKASKSP